MSAYLDVIFSKDRYFRANVIVLTSINDNGHEDLLAYLASISDENAPNRLYVAYRKIKLLEKSSQVLRNMYPFASMSVQPTILEPIMSTRLPCRKELERNKKSGYHQMSTCLQICKHKKDLSKSLMSNPICQTIHRLKRNRCMPVVILTSTLQRMATVVEVIYKLPNEPNTSGRLNVDCEGAEIGIAV